MGAAQSGLTDIRSKIRSEESNISELKAGDIYKSDPRLQTQIQQREATINALRQDEQKYLGTYNFVKSGDYAKTPQGLRNAFTTFSLLDEPSRSKYMGTPVKLASDTQQLDALGKPMVSTGPTPVPVVPQSAPAITVPPTEYAAKTGLNTLQDTVMNTNASLSANADFINGAFKAFHNRDATKEELAQYTGKNVGSVRNEIIGGAQSAGLPTVSHGTSQEGLLTPEAAVAQGLQKVLRPDQLSAFREDQIIRDNRGGIYLRPETTTQDVRDKVASGASGTALSSIPKPAIDTMSIDAEKIQQGIDKGNVSGYIQDETSSGTPPAEAYSRFTDTALGPLQATFDALTAQIAASQAALATEESRIDTITGKITALNSPTANQDALARAERDAGLSAKHKVLQETLSQIANEKAKLQLGLIQEENKIAPMAIISGRQNALQQQAMARIGALTSIAQIQQDDEQFAKTMVDAAVTAINADRKAQLDTLNFLLDQEDKKVLKLTNEENSAIKAQSDLITKAMDSAQKNADKVFDLIKSNPDAALSGKVSISDTPALALSKMAPFMSAAKEPTLREVGGNLYSLSFNKETGKWDSQLVKSKSGGSTPSSNNAPSSPTPKVELISKDEFVKQYIETVGETAGMSPDISNPNIKAQIDSLYDEYLRSSPSNKTSVPDASILKSISSSDKKKMYARGLNPDDVADVKSYLADEYSGKPVAGNNDDNPFE